MCVTKISSMCQKRPSMCQKRPTRPWSFASPLDPPRKVAKYPPPHPLCTRRLKYVSISVCSRSLSFFTTIRPPLSRPPLRRESVSYEIYYMQALHKIVYLFTTQNSTFTTQSDTCHARHCAASLARLLWQMPRTRCRRYLASLGFRVQGSVCRV